MSTQSILILQPTCTNKPLQQNPDQSTPSNPKTSDSDFTFVGGVYPSLQSANTAALALAAEKCNCEIPALTFPTSSTAFAHTTTTIPNLNPNPSNSPSHDISHHASGSGSLSSANTSPLLGPTSATARPQLIQQRSGDGRYSCRCTSSSEDGSESKGIRFEVRKIEVRPLWSRMGWNFSDDDA